MIRRLALLYCALLLSACAQVQVKHYLPSGEGELRNRSLCTFGLRDELEMTLTRGVKLRVWGGDPESSALAARVQMIVPPGQHMRFTSNRFELFTNGATAPTVLHTTGITTVCPEGDANCQSRFAPTDRLEGGVTVSDNLLKSADPKTYRLDLAVPLPPGEAYTLKLPDVEVNWDLRQGITVRFEKTSTPAAANLAVCQ